MYVWDKTSCEQEINLDTVFTKCKIAMSIPQLLLCRLVPESHHTEFPYTKMTHFNNWISNSYIHTVKKTQLTCTYYNEYTTSCCSFLSRNLPKHGHAFPLCASVATVIPIQGYCNPHVWTAPGPREKSHACVKL